MSIYSHSFLLLLCTCTTFIQPVPYWWILELFLTFAITTNAAKNILVHTSFCTFASVSLGESFRSVTAGSRVNSLATATTGTVPPALYPHQWYVRMYSEASDLKAYQGWEPWHLKISYENYEEKSSRWLVPRGSVQFTDCAVYSQKPWLGSGVGGGGRDHEGGRQSGVGMMLLIQTKAVSPSQGGKTQRFPAPIFTSQRASPEQKARELESNSPVPGE